MTMTRSMITEHWRALLAVTVRNLRIARRRPDLLVQTMAVPVVILGLASIIFGATDAWPIAVVDNSNSPQSTAVRQALADTRGATGPYFRTITTDETEAQHLLEQGRIHLAITIPADFPQTRRLETQSFNINTDAMKNVRLRLSTMANLHDQRAGLLGATVRLDKVKPVDVTRTAFMGGSAVILAILLGAALVSANLFALDTEHRTRKEMALTPVGAGHAAAGAALAGTLLALPAALPTMALAWSFGTRTTWTNLVQSGAIVLPAAFACAGAGVLVAVALRTHRLIQPVIILVALGSYFASGGFIPVPALPPLARALDVWWPPSYVFEWVNPVLHDFAAQPSTTAINLSWVAAGLLSGCAVAAAQRSLRRAHLQGQ